MKNRYFEKSLSAIQKNGWLLVFPIKQQTSRRAQLAPSLWKFLFPRSELVWEWTDDGDDRVFKVWHLRTELAQSKQVVYSKWYLGRATFFSFEVFQRLWILTEEMRENLGREAREILDLLEMESPLSTKEIRKNADLLGKVNERRFQNAMKELWSSCAIVGIGEIEDGAFPSLAHAATSTVFEELILEIQKNAMNRNDAETWLRQRITDTRFLKQLGLAAVKP